MECPKHLFRKILCHGKTSLSWWQIINYPPTFPKTEKITPKKHHNLSSSFLHISTRKSTTVHAKQVFAGGKLYFLLASFPHKQKNTTIYPLHSYTFPPENQLLHSLKRVLLPSHPPLPFPLSFSYIYSSRTPKIPHFTRL